ncbi:MAG: restriction endonuclease subunit S [Bacteroidetes bacterium]|nr:restriction endonuclease subunit S [Bacteroidota bacterium]
MREWKEYKLGEVVTFQRGHDLTKTEMQEGNIPVAGSNGIIGFHTQHTTKAPGLTIGRSGNIGTPHYYDTDFWAHNTVLFVKEFILTEPKYFYYYLHTIDFTQFNAGSSVPTLNRNHIHQLDISLPSLPEQTAIAEVLSSLDDKIDLLHRQNKTLEQLAETLFRQWFVEEAEEGWEVGTIDDVVSMKGGTTPSTTEQKYWDGDIHWTSPRDLSNTTSIFLFDTSRKITEEGLKQISSGLLPVSTLLLSSRAPIGYLALTEIPVAINQGYIAIICDKIVSNYFMFLWCKANMEMIENAGNGSVFQEISKSAFRTLDFLVPPKEKIKHFDKEIEPMFQKIKSNTTQIRTLTQLRDTLLPKLMSGEVRVSEPLI